MSDMIEFTAKVIGDVGRRDAQIQRALQVLQRAQRYDAFCDNTGETMEPCSRGDWVLFDDVSQAIKILQEGQQ